ncbi:CatB-related O-acetyltransferase [Soonwooa sp.]|uniref:CatB-related O-acetyltransferase n=1 Tax=Soonwooa sp. TaxID=1938592 RepID=UPI0035AFA458
MIRKFLWRLLGIDYNQILNKLDYVLLKNDLYKEIGRGTYDNGAKVWRWTKSPLIIGNYCSIAHGVNFIVDEGYHQSSEISNYPFIHNKTTEEKCVKIRNTFQQKEGIKIGNDVWIGMNCIILPGVEIGNGVTIAAGSVVHQNVPDYAVVGGVPARIIKMKHNTETIQKLNKIAWWDWPIRKIDENRIDFYLSIEEFIQKYAD